VAGQVRVGEFRFDLATGELTPAAATLAETEAKAVRLAPQPAELLRLLVEKKGELLSREEIHAALWPDVHVEVDQALSFCVRQVRTALGDSAAEPRYVETLPRRGYRLLAPIREEAADHTGDEADAEGTGLAATTARRGRHRAWAALLVVLLLAGVAAWSVSRRNATAPDKTRPSPSFEPAVRLGIMPFAAPIAAGVESDTRRIADHLVAELGRTDPRRLGVVGPRTTAAYDDSAAGLRRLSRDYRLDFVVNGRFLETADGPVLLVELIRLQDGVHLWVQRFSPLDDPEAVAATIAAAVGSRLELETRTVEPATPSPAGG